MVILLLLITGCFNKEKDKKADKELLDQASDIINHGIFDLKTEYENKKKSKKNRK